MTRWTPFGGGPATLHIPDAWDAWTYRGERYTRVDLLPVEQHVILDILRLGHQSVHGLAREMPDTHQTVILDHLRALRDAGLVVRTRPHGHTNERWALPETTTDGQAEEADADRTGS